MEPVVTMTKAEYFASWIPWLILIGGALLSPIYVLLFKIWKRL